MEMYTNELRVPNTPTGIGDPFVLRHNGRYYLYPSTPGGECGVACWTSLDMVNWEFARWVVRDACLQNTYAPEVWYFNGQFLLVGSPFGSGHYLYTSDSPLGPFRKVRDNFGLVIDGSIFVDDDARLYFTHAEYPCIHGHEMTVEGDMGEPTAIEGSGMGHWTEGSGIFKRGGKYYITMTGNHLMSRAYRIDYAVSDVGPLGPYRVPEQKTLLVNTDRAHGSLGHSSNAIGPDLDSYWICYHNFEIDERGRHIRRNVNLDRMLFNGEKLMVSGPTRHHVESPKRPDAYGWADEDDSKFVAWDDGVQLQSAAPDSFTAEINIVPGPRAEVCFGYVDAENYGSVTIEGGALILSEVSCGAAKILAEKQLFQGFDPDVLHTIRLELRGGALNVLLDHMGQLSGIAVSGGAGRIGARGAVRISYVAFSRHVGQRGDFEHYHALPGAIDAAMFAPACVGALSGGHAPDQCGFRPEDGMRLVPGRDGAQDLLLSEGELVSYRANAASAGRYHVRAALMAEAGAKLRLRFRGGELDVCVAPSTEIVQTIVGEVSIYAGLQNFDLSVTEGDVRLSRIELFPVPSAIEGEWSGLALCAAAQRVEGGSDNGFLTRFEGLQMDREVQAMGIFGDRFLTDGFIEADIRFRGEGIEKSAGLFLRLSENSYYYEQIVVGHRGYYIGFDADSVRIDRMNFGAITLARAALPGPIELERPYRVRAEICGGDIRVFLDGAPVLSASEPDPLPFGQMAVGSFGARITVERAAINAK